MYKRQFNIASLLKRKSFFLLGARSTGKSFWIRKTIEKDTLYINLLSAEICQRLSNSPSYLEKMIDESNYKNIVIDEIQKIPELLDEVHRMIEEKRCHFVITGSSARKLKRSNANMLGGRAALVHFFPLSFSEVPQFNLSRFLTYGGLPRVYDSDDPQLELDSYLSTYIEQEVKLEANVRNLAPFHRFLKTAALCNSELINYANIANDANVPASTVKEYYSILEDSLIGYVLEPWLESKKRKAIQTAKFYFFDPGVCNFIANTKTVERNSNLWGKNFEQFILMELKAYNSYSLKHKKFYFWRSVNKQEVDFIINDEIAIEVKSTNKVSAKHFTGLKALKEEQKIKKFFIISEDPIERTEDKFIHCLNYKTFLNQLWTGKIF